MKRNFLSILLVALGVTAISCQKQEEHVEPPKVKHVQLTEEESRWLALQDDGDRTSAEILNAALQLPEFATKGFSMKITDSIVVGNELTKSDSFTDPLVVYVVSSGDEGFALVSKDKILPEVIGQFDGSFDKDNLNPNFEFMLGFTMEQLDYLRDSLRLEAQKPIESDILNELQFAGATKSLIGPEEPPTIPVPWTHYSDFIVDREWTEYINVLNDGREYLLTTRWGQYYPYNAWRSDGYPAGCAATAAAQIMAYYRKPLISPMDCQPYDWAAMHNDLYGQGKDDVGRLMKDLGHPSNLSITYTSNGSGAARSNITPTFLNFDYSFSSSDRYGSGPIVKATRAGRPVYICGDNIEDGHAWVVDGAKEVRYMQELRIDFYYYSDLVYQIYLEPSIYQSIHAFHHNFGWSGGSNGWFTNPSNYPLGLEHNLQIWTNIYPR